MELVASAEGVRPRGGMCKTRKGECVYGAVSMGKLSVGGFTHLDTTFGPQLIGGLHLFILDKELAVS